MEVELFHRDNLAVAAAGRAAFDAERRSLAGLANAGEHLLAEVRSQALAEPDRGGRLTFTQWGGRDRGHDDVLAVADVLEPVPNGEVHFRLGLAVEFQLLGKNARFGGNPVNGNRRGRLGDFDITGNGGEEVR